MKNLPVAPTEDRTSEFNMALEFLRTLRNILNICDAASTRMDVPTWYAALILLRRELSDDMNPTQLSKANEYKDRLQPPVQNLLKRINNKQPITVSATLYNDLDNFELFLRKVMADKGYKVRMSDSSWAALKA